MKKIFYNQDLGLLIFRLFIGLTMAFAHGMGKLPPPDQLVEGVGSMGFPAPIFFAWCAALAEFVGALCIAFGLFTRYAAGFLAFTMGVAAFLVHSADAFAKKELALLYFFSCVLFIFSGAGKYALDTILCKKCSKK